MIKSTKNNLTAIKLNESFYELQGSREVLQAIKKRFTVKKPNAFFDPMIKRGFKPDSEVFYAVHNDNIIIPTGLMYFLKDFGIYFQKISEYSEQEIRDFVSSLNLPFKPYDYQIQIIIDSIIRNQQICLAATGSGKSLCLFAISSFLRSKGLKGLILVPSISLTTQLYDDFRDYGASESFLDSIRQIGGDNNIKKLDKDITISTWQSAAKFDNFKSLHYIIVDEAQQLKFSNISTDIVYNSINARYRIGLTGTLPDDPLAKMSVLACTGSPTRYISTQGLIERGLATPVHINVIKLRYGTDDQALFKYVGKHAQRLKFIKEHKNRNILISKLSIKITENGNTVVMCSHVQHMKDIFIELMKLKGVDNIEEKNITGKKALDFQKTYNIYYIAGSTKSKDREQIIEILKSNDHVILVSNYQLFSTGLNIRSLKNIVFASPLKSYTTITQSIGRAIRLHISKNTAEIYDFVDCTGSRVPESGPFVKQYQERLSKSYMTEGFPLTESTVLI